MVGSCLTGNIGHNPLWVDPSVGFLGLGIFLRDNLLLPVLGPDVRTRVLRMGSEYPGDVVRFPSFVSELGVVARL